MGIFDKVGSFLKREADDLGDAAEGVEDKFDQELTKRETELEMTPSEKIAALQQEAAASDARIDAIVNKAADRGAMADAVAEVGEISPDVQLPTVTHIVLPDGRVKSGDDVSPPSIDVADTASDVPVVDAPTAEDLAKFDPPPPAPVVEDLPTPPVAEEAPLPEPPLPEAPLPEPPAPVVEDLPAPPSPVAEEPPAPAPEHGPEG